MPFTSKHWPTFSSLAVFCQLKPERHRTAALKVRFFFHCTSLLATNKEMQNIFRALQNFNWGPLVMIQKLLFSSCCSSSSVVIVVSSLFPCGVMARKKTGRFKDVNTRTSKDVSQELASCAVTARPPRHDTTGPRHRAFDVFQGSCYNASLLFLHNGAKELKKWPKNSNQVVQPLSGTVTIIGDFWQPFCVGKNNGGHKARPRKTTIARTKRRLLNSAWAAKLFARLTELACSDVRDTCASSHHFLLTQKKRKKSLNIVTLPLQNIRIFGIG